jgi:hypothetical protein
VAGHDAPSHDDGTGRVDRLAEALGVRVRLSALHAVALAERFQRHGPFVQPLPAFAQRVLEARIGPATKPSNDVVMSTIVPMATSWCRR